MAERTNSELFTKNSLKLQTGSFVTQSNVQDQPEYIVVTTGSVPILDKESGVDTYRGSITKTYNLPVVKVKMPSALGVEWYTTISGTQVNYTAIGPSKNTSYKCIANVLMGETTLILPYNIQAILNGVIIVGDVEYVLVQPHQFNLKNTIIFEDLNNNKIEWSKKGPTTWTALTEVDLRKSSVFLTYLI